MRLFVGIPLASEVLNELSEAVARLRRPDDGLRWTAPESWHITLQFLGNTDQQHCDCVLAHLKEIQAVQLRIALGELGFFDRAGVFFASVIPTLDLVELAKRVTAATASCRFVAETRPYHPHITLARAKGDGKERALRALQEQMKRVQRLQPARFSGFTATEFRLYESHTRPEGAAYEVLRRFGLGPAG